MFRSFIVCLSKNSHPPLKINQQLPNNAIVEENKSKNTKKILARKTSRRSPRQSMLFSINLFHIIVLLIGLILLSGGDGGTGIQGAEAHLNFPVPIPYDHSTAFYLRFRKGALTDRKFQFFVWLFQWNYSNSSRSRW